MNSPLYVTILNVCIAIVVGVVVCFTSNPMAILALFFLQPVPVVQFNPAMLDAYSDEGDEDDGGNIGFTAELKK